MITILSLLKKEVTKHRSAFIIIIISFVASVVNAQNNKDKLSPDKFNLNQLRTYVGRNKTLIQGFELPALVALSYYPELLDTKITFRFKSIKSAGLTTFTIGSILRREKHYLVTLNNDKRTTGISFKDAHFNAQIGLIAHELAHVVEIQNKSNAGIAVWGFSYVLNKNSHRNIERSTDESTIAHGLGWQLYDWLKTINTSLLTTVRYKKMKESFYLSEQEVLSRIESRQ